MRHGQLVCCNICDEDIQGYFIGKTMQSNTAIIETKTHGIFVVPYDKLIVVKSNRPTSVNRINRLFFESRE